MCALFCIYWLQWTVRNRSVETFASDDPIQYDCVTEVRELSDMSAVAYGIQQTQCISYYDRRNFDCAGWQNINQCGAVLWDSHAIGH